MKIKYYLRGLATGIVIAAILMALSMSGKQTLSDEEIRERAAKLGMVMAGGTTLSPGEKQGEPSENKTETPEKQENAADKESAESAGAKTPGEGDEPGKEEEPKESEKPGAGEAPEAEEKAQETQEAGKTGESAGEEQPGKDEAEGRPAEGKETDSESPETVTVVIRSGFGSIDVAKALKSAGLVENVLEFDDFLCEHGYDKYLCVDSYQIPVGSSYEQIARIITKRMR